MDYSDCVLVTGGTGIVGSAVVRTLLDSGERVALTYRSSNHDFESLQAYASSGSGKLYVKQVDFSSFDVVEVVNGITSGFGPVKSLVHAAALVDHTPLDSLEVSRFSDVLAVNVTAAYELVRELVARGTLCDVVLLSSIASSIADLGSVAYTTSKGAVDSLTRALASNLSPKVRVNAIAPGIVKSHRTEGDPLFSGPSAKIDESFLIEPKDIATMIAFLLENEPRSISGQILTIDSGVSLRRLG